MKTLNGNFREYKLSNGLCVVLQATHTQTISGKLIINYGALHEKPGEEGLAHYLEHGFMSGGTQKNDPEQSDKISGSFGFFNAMTGLDKTYIPVDMLAEDLELYLDFASEMVFHPRLDSKRVYEERARVIREIADEKSTPGFLDRRDYFRALYGDHPCLYFIPGKESVVNNASAEDLRRFHSSGGYNATNMNLILVGNLPSTVDDLIFKYFGRKPSGETTKFEFPPVKELKENVEIFREAPEFYNEENPSESSAQISLGFLVPPDTSDCFAALRILSNILGGDSNSKLFKEISLRRGLAYGIGSGYDGSYNKGVLYINGSVVSIRQEEAINCIFEEIRKLRDELVPKADLERIVRKGRYGLGKHFETNEGHIAAIESKLETGKDPEILMSDWEKITPGKIQEVANRYLPAKRGEGKYVLLVRDPLK